LGGKQGEGPGQGPKEMHREVTLSRVRVPRHERPLRRAERKGKLLAADG